MCLEGRILLLPPPRLAERKTRGRKSRRGVFLITQIYTGPSPNGGRKERASERTNERTVRIPRTRRAGWEEQWHANLWPFRPSPFSLTLPSSAAICLFSSRRCNPLGTKRHPSSLTLISRMRYNREHNLEIARIIPATGLIKACVYIYIPPVCTCISCTVRFTTVRPCSTQPPVSPQTEEAEVAISTKPWTRAGVSD